MIDAMFSFQQSELNNIYKLSIIHCIHTQNYNPGCYNLDSTHFPVHTQTQCWKECWKKINLNQLLNHSCHYNCRIYILLGLNLHLLKKANITQFTE